MRSRRNSPAEETINWSLLLVLIWLLPIGRAHFGQLRLQRLDVRRLRGYEVLLGWSGLPRCGVSRGKLRWWGCAVTRLARDCQRLQKKNCYRLVGIHRDNRNANLLLPSIGKLAPLRRHFCGHLVPQIVSLGKWLVQGTLPGELGGNNSSASSDTRGASKCWIPLSLDLPHETRAAIFHQCQAGNCHFLIVGQHD